MNNDIFYKITTEIPTRIFVGNGISFYINGYFYHREKTVSEMHITLGNQKKKISYGLYSNDLLDHNLNNNNRSSRDKLFSRFSTSLVLPKQLKGLSLPLTITATMCTGECLLLTQKHINFIDNNQYYLPVKLTNKYNKTIPLIAICMATHNPHIQSFEKQIHSILDQKFTNWICIINDDNSDDGRTQKIKKIICNDERFYFFQNKKKLNFYKNFETVLKRIPEEAKYVALSDQDDFWFPEKLDILVDKIDPNPNINLVFSDMRIVKPDFTIIHQSYWKNRENHYDNFIALLFANTVTGAASIFRANLIKNILPFPNKVGNIFHDHFIGCISSCNGKISYIDRPLQYYIQYGDNVIGHCDFITDPTIRFFRRKVEKIKYRSFKLFFKTILDNSERIYNDEYLKIISIYNTLRQRNLKIPRKIRFSESHLINIIYLVIYTCYLRYKSKTTGNIEINILISLIVIYSTSKLFLLDKKIKKLRFKAGRFFKNI